jgi:DNA-binding NtrC family response regulator
MTQLQPYSLPSRPASVASASSGAELALTLLGPSAAMAQLWSQMRRLAPHVRIVLLQGKPDCGQEAVAQLLLELSAQSHRLFVQLTAAEADRRLTRHAGLSSLPTDVFLYLPDVEHFSAEAQDALLRLIRLRRPRLFTLVAAAGQDLRALAAAGRFLPELASLLSSVHIPVPELHDRAEDLPMLIGHSLAGLCRTAGRDVPHITEGFLRAAMHHRWHGNLRELTRVLASLVQDRTRRELCPEHLVAALAAHPVPAAGPVTSPARLVSLDTVVNEHIGAVLQACHGNKLRAAEILGISRSTLYRMLDSVAAAQPNALPLAS